MKNYCDVPVVLIFFNRPDTLTKVFQQVRLARPRKLFLIQDGPRKENSDDPVRIQQCRNIVEAVDWECKVYKNYSVTNQGCGERPSSGISWVFEQVDRAIILEDDCVPELSFFQYCEILLEKYKSDTRIGMISGLNHFITWNTGGKSYFFAKTGANWGWATWRRVWKNYDYHLTGLQDTYVTNLMKGTFLSKRIEVYSLRKFKITRKKIEKKEKLSYWDIQLNADKYMNHWLTIIPRKNMICNIGTGDGATHNSRRTPYNHLPIYRLKHIVHPKYVIQDTRYDRKYYQRAYPGLPIIIYQKFRRKMNWAK